MHRKAAVRSGANVIIFGVRLTQIKLSGFKSFVDPTSIHVPGKLVGGLSGLMAQSWGYTGFFMFSTISVLPALLLLLWLWPRLPVKATSEAIARV